MRDAFQIAYMSYVRKDAAPQVLLSQTAVYAGRIYTKRSAMSCGRLNYEL